MLPHRRRTSLVLALLPLLAMAAHAQCGTQWIPHPVSIAGANGPVSASTTWDPDGAGPAPAVLVVGGAFTKVGAVLANHIAAYEPGTGTWSALAAGVNGTVHALAVLATGELVVGGTFTTAGGSAANRIAQWNGSTWSPMQQGTNDTVHALAVMANGDLAVGGAFTLADTVGANRLARWNASTGWNSWSGLPATGPNGTVHALHVLQSGDLVAGGDFTAISGGGGGGGNTHRRIARWNGTAWQRFGPSTMNNGTNGIVRGVAELANGDVVATGDFTSAAGTTVGNVARWDGTAWTSLGTGLDAPGRCLRVLATGDLVVGGDFLLAGGGTANHVAMWNGAAWSALGTDLVGSVLSMSVLPNGDLVACGSFGTLGTPSATGIARWTGTAWDALAVDGAVLGTASCLVTVPNGDIVTAGNFSRIGGVAANSIARWDGTAWHALGSGILGQVRALLALQNGDVVVGGLFRTAGGVAAACVARWDGTTWSAMPGLVVTPTGFVNSLALASDGKVIAGGSFTTSGPIQNLAKWDGATWTPLSSSATTTGVTASVLSVHAMTTLVNGVVLVAGTFTNQIGLQRMFARWDGTNLFAHDPLGVVGTVHTMTAFGIGAAFGGSFTSILGQLGQYNNIGWVDGVFVAPLGTGLSGSCFALQTLPDGDLLAGGSFATAGSNPAANLARWNGTTWSAIGAGTNGAVRAITRKANGDYMICGDFTTVDGMESPDFATLTTTCPATAQTFAPGCPSSGGSNTLVADTLPFVDGTFRATATGLPATAIVLTVTSTAAVVPGFPLSLAFPQAGPGCELYLSPDILGVLVTTTGTATSQFLLPNVPPLVGVTFYHQMIPIELDAFGAWTAVSATNVLQLTAGQF